MKKVIALVVVLILAAACVMQQPEEVPYDTYEREAFVQTVDERGFVTVLDKQGDLWTFQGNLGYYDGLAVTHIGDDVIKEVSAKFKY